MSRCLSYHQSCIGGGAARRYALDLQWKLSTLFETLEVKFTPPEKAMQHVLLKTLANVGSMQYFAWVR